jgi:hypothetical protein
VINELMNFFRARQDAQTPVGRQMQSDLNAQTDEQYAESLNRAHIEQYGSPIPAAPAYTPPKEPWRGLPPGKVIAAAGQGVINAAFEMNRTVGEIGQWASEQDDGMWSALGEGIKAITLPEGTPTPQILPGKQSGGEKVVTSLTQFAAPFIPLSKALEGYQLFKVAGQNASWLAKFGNEAARGALASLPVDFAAFDPIESNLANVAEQFGFLPEWAEFMKSKSTDGDVEEQLMNRVRAATFNLPVGVAAQGVISAPGIAAENAAAAFMMASKGLRAVREVNWSSIEKQGFDELDALVSERGRLNDLGGAADIGVRQAAAVAKIVAGRIGRLTKPGRKAFDRTGELPGTDELADGLIAQGADPAAVREGINMGLTQHANPDEHTMQVDKREGGRDVMQRASLPQEVRARIEASAPSPRAAADAMSRARETMVNYPARDGWVEIVPGKITYKPNGKVNVIEWKAKDPREQKFTFHLDPATGKANARSAGAREDRLAEMMVAEVREVERRAAAGDRNAQVIQRQRGWYTNMRTRLREEFGGAGQLVAELLGATSPNTAVPQNWDNMIGALRGFVRGEYDEQLAKMEQWRADGNSLNDFPADDKIRKASGALFGMNSGGAMQAMLDIWKAIEPGQAPKARNFAGNLIGTSDKATIDVWAARMLQRLSGGKRLPALLGSAVDGNQNANATAVLGQYGFGERVFEKAAAQLGMDPHELQAYAWFAEKELWTQNHWTTLAGEGGSFEQMADAAGLTRYQAGVSVQQDAPPLDAEVAAAQPRLEASLKGDENVLAYRAMPTTGMYAGSAERSFDMELTAKPEWKPNKWVSDLATVAMEKNQYDVLVSKVLNADEVLGSENARPGVEVYFADQKSLDAIMPMIEQITAKGQDGFTFVVDPRMRMKGEAGADAGQYVGVRLQFVPEISMRWDENFRAEMAANPEQIRAIIAEKSDAMLDIVNELQQAEGVLSAHHFHYDSFVMGKENYDDYITGADAAGAGAGADTPWFGRTYSENLGSAARRLSGGDSAAAVPEPGAAAAGEKAGAVDDTFEGKRKAKTGQKWEVFDLDAGDDDPLRRVFSSKKEARAYLLAHPDKNLDLDEFGGRDLYAPPQTELTADDLEEIRGLLKEVKESKRKEKVSNTLIEILGRDKDGRVNSYNVKKED